MQSGLVLDADLAEIFAPPTDEPGALTPEVWLNGYIGSPL
jgi:hypothetical protein